MVTGGDELAEIIREAEQLGEIVVPTELISHLSKIDDPINVLQHDEQAHALFAAFNKDFGFVQAARFARKPLQPSDRSRCAALMRWMIQQLRHWRAVDDSRCRTLAAVFIAAQIFDADNRLWTLLPNDIGDNHDLFERLNGLLGTFGVIFTTHGAKAPIWESDAVQEFQEADAAGNWLAIIRAWQLFPPFFPGVPQTHAVRCLYRYGVQRLVEAVAGLRQTPAAMQVAGILTVEQRLTLAVASDNPYVQLASVYRTLADRPVPKSLSSGDQKLLMQLLLKVTNDIPRWLAWMHIFNAYPFHYPALQAPLAETLAIGPNSVLEAYVNSILLVKMEPGRQSVAACLRMFRLKASPERRAALWTVAHDRWRAWAFTKADLSQHLMALARAELDYAVVGYACECMNEVERTKAVTEIGLQMFALEDEWHASFTDMLTGWNRLLSQFQPYAHAISVSGTMVDWLCEVEKTYRPFDQTQQPYLMMKYRVQ